MPRSSKINEQVLDALQDAQTSIQVWGQTPLEISLTRLVLRQAKAGCRVDFLISRPHWAHLEIADRYLERLEEAGGHIYFYDGQSEGRSFMLIDDDTLLCERYMPFLDRYEMGVLTDEWVLKYQDRFDEYLSQAKRFESSTAGAYQTDSPQQAGEEPVKIQFTARPEQVDIAEPFELSWTVEGATNVIISQGIGAVGRNGRKILRAEKDVTFLLTAQSRNGQFTASAAVAVNPAAKITYRLTTFEPGSGQEILVSPLASLPNYYSVVKGQLLRVYWRVFNADSVQHSELGEVSAEGMHDFMVTELSTFSIIARQGDTTIQQAIVLNVLDLVQVDAFLAQVQQQQPELPTDGPTAPAINALAADALLPPPPPLEKPSPPDSLWQKLGNFFVSKNDGDEQ